MRPYSILLIIAVLIFTTCKDDDGLPLTPDLVTSLKAYDLDNNGNSSDIRVDFEVENNLNVSEYRVMVIPTNSSNSFTESIAISIPRENFLIEFPVPFQTKYPIDRLPSTLLDVNGALIINGVEYVIAILIEGIGNFQLSGFSRPLTLLDRGIYDGYYEGEGCCGLSNFEFITVQLARSGDFYSGDMEILDYTSNIRFNVVNEIISDCTVRGGRLGQYLGVGVRDPGTGIIIDDLIMEITFIHFASAPPYVMTLIRTIKDD